MSKFLHELHERKLKYKRSDSEVRDIKEAVHEVIETTAAKIGQQEHAFEISHSYLAGSMAEGTSIKEPKEFDVLLVLKHLSTPGAVGIEKVMIENRDCYNDPEANSKLPRTWKHFIKHIHAHVSALSSNARKMFSFCVTNGYLGNYDLNLSFNNEIVKAFKSLSPVKRETGVLSINSADEPTEGSASTFTLQWASSSNTTSLALNISVDLVPAIELLGVDTGDLDPEFKAYNDRLISDNKYLVIPGKLAHKCFLFTFTNTEVSLIRGMSDDHKICYRLLKYILQIRIHSKVFSSYMTKTFVLRHAAFCREDADVLRCICDIIKDMSASFGTLYKDPKYQHRIAIRTDVRCIFMKSNYISTNLYGGQECGGIITGLSSIIKQLEDIKKKEETEGFCFERCFETFDTFVRHLRRSYLFKKKHEGC